MNLLRRTDQRRIWDAMKLHEGQRKPRARRTIAVRYILAAGATAAICCIVLNLIIVPMAKIEAVRQRMERMTEIGRQ